VQASASQKFEQIFLGDMFAIHEHDGILPSRRARRIKVNKIETRNNTCTCESTSAIYPSLSYGSEKGTSGETGRRALL
jgi:hypothetical protein